MYCTLTWQVISFKPPWEMLVRLAVSMPAHFELAFPRWGAFRSRNAISSFCRTSHYHFATPQSPNLSTHLPINPSSYQPFTSQSIFLPTHLPINPSSYQPFTSQSIFLSTHLPINPSSYQPIFLSTHLPINPSSYQPIFLSTLYQSIHCCHLPQKSIMFARFCILQ